jgi:hypothetical protein
MEWTLRSLAALGVSAGLTLVPVSGFADTSDQPFLVTTTTQTAHGTIEMHDVMIFHADPSGTTYTVTGSDGDASQLLRDRTCFDVIERILTAGPSRKGYAIGVAIEGQNTVVPVAMSASVAQPGAGARLVEANGDGSGEVIEGPGRLPVGVHIEAKVLAQDGHLQSATFQQLMYLATPAQPVQVNACAMQRLPPATSPAAAPAPPSPA